MLLDVEGLNFKESFDRRTEVNLGEIKVNFLNINDLIRAKETAGRLQDLADAEQLRKINKEQENSKKDKA